MNERDLVTAYLNKVKKKAGVSSDADLAGCLEVGKATISAWRQRGNVPFRVQKEIHKKYGVIFEGNDVHMHKEADFCPHIGTLLFLTMLARGEKLSFDGKIETAYWWARRVPYLTQIFGEELVSRCQIRHTKLSKMGMHIGYFDAHSLTDNELRDAVEGIAFDIEEERFLRLSEIESLPYKDR